MVELNNPPITTVASGRCTSAPVEVAIAIGTKPRLATHRRHQHRHAAFVALPASTASRTDTPAANV